MKSALPVNKYTNPRTHLPGERGLNLRRRGSDAVRPANNTSEIEGNDAVSFTFPADAAVLRIFKNYTTFRQLFTYAI
jgi:hypothetical protein